MNLCSCHIKYAFQSESTFYRCLNVKEHLALNRRDIGSWNDCNGTRTDNHLVRKQTLKHLAKLAKWLSCGVSTYLYQYPACFVQKVPWHSGNYRAWIYSEMHTWHDKNIQTNVPNRWVLATQLNHLASLAKWLSVCLRTKWLSVQVLLQSLKNDSLCIKNYFKVRK